MDCPPYGFQVDAKVGVYQDVAHVLPGHLRPLVSNFVWDMIGGFTYDFQSANYREVSPATGGEFCEINALDKL